MKRRSFVKGLFASTALAFVNPVTFITETLPVLPPPVPTVPTSFQAMLNEYLTYDLLKEELLKRDYLFNRIEDDGWQGGTISIPLKVSNDN